MNPALAPAPKGAYPPRPTSPIADAGGPAPVWPVAILGVPFDHVTTAAALQRIDAMIASRCPHYVVTANVDFLVQAHRDVELRRILLEADLVLCDGTPVLWASRWLGNALPERVAGSDLAPALLRSAAEKGHRIFLLGAAEGVAAGAATKLGQQYPNLKVVGHYAPPFSSLLEMNHEEIARRVTLAEPDILLVSFGCPKQEKWIAMHHRSLGVPVAMGVGATLDFLAGRMKRAPAWMRRTGTEWLYRLANEPKRLYKRYADDLACFVPTLARHWCKLHQARPQASCAREITSEKSGWSIIDAGVHLTRCALDEQAPFWREVQQRAAHCMVDLSNLRRIDATGVAFLIRWRKSLLARSHHLILLAPPPGIRRVLHSLKLADHFVIVADVAAAEAEVANRFTRRPVQRDGELRSLAWCGEIIAANVADVWRITSDHVQTFAARKTTLIIIDLAQVRFIDSSGAALMLRLKSWAQSLQVEVLFSHPQSNVRNVLRLTRLEQLLLEGGQ